MAKGTFSVTAHLLTNPKVRELLSAKTLDVAKKTAKKQSMAIARDMREQLRADTPVKEGVLRRATKAKSTRGGGAVVYVDRSGGASGKGYHSHIVDKGTKKRTTKAGANRGAMPAANYVEPIRARARARVANEMAPAVLAEMAKVAK